MQNLKKTFILALFVALGVSPLIPSVKATDGQWQNSVSEASWSYEFYDVDRLVSTKTIGSVSQLNNVVFRFDQAKSTLEFFKNGNVLMVSGVNQIVPAKNRFVYTTTSVTKDSWVTVYEYLPSTGTIQTLYTIPRRTDDLKFTQAMMDGTRLYTSVLHVDQKTKAVESKLSVYDTASTYMYDDFSWNANVPLQEIMDVRDGQVIARFQFSGGFKQLVIIDSTARTVKEIPGTWTEPPGDLLAAHFLSNGSILFFQNYRLYSFDPTVLKTTPVEIKNAHLNWFVKPEQAYQLVGDRMAFIDAENNLSVVAPEGVTKLGKALSGAFFLEENAVHYQTAEGYITYNFLLQHASQRNFRVTDAFDEVVVGVDADAHIWVENTTSGEGVNVGFGTDPVLTDADHVLWKGTDGKLYQATISPLLSLNQHLPAGTAGFTPGTRVKSQDNARVYVVGNDGKLHWIISETVAFSIFGDNWNRHIVEVPAYVLWNYQSGLDVDSKHGINSI